MADLFELSVVTSGGIEDLGRVAGVLALHALTPRYLASELNGAGGLNVQAGLEGERLACGRCAKRIGALVCVRSVDLRDLPGVQQVPEDAWTAATHRR